MPLETFRTMPKKKLPTGPIRIDLPSMGIENKLESNKQDSTKIENNKIESSQKDSNQVESTIVESNKQESDKIESSKVESGLKDSNRIETSIIESSQKDSAQTESFIPESNREETNKVKRSSEEYNKPDSIREEKSKLTSNLVNSDLSIKEDDNQESSLPENRIIESAIIEKQNQESNIFSLEQKPESGLLESKKVAMRLSSEAASTLRQFRAETGIPYEIIVDVMIRNWSNLPNRTKTGYLKQARQIRQMRLMAGQEKTLATMRQKYSEQT